MQLQPDGNLVAAAFRPHTGAMAHSTQLTESDGTRHLTVSIEVSRAAACGRPQMSVGRCTVCYLVCAAACRYPHTV